MAGRGKAYGHTLGFALARSDAEAAGIDIAGIAPAERPETLDRVDPILKQPETRGGKAV